MKKAPYIKSTIHGKNSANDFTRVFILFQDFCDLDDKHTTFKDLTSVSIIILT